MNIKIIPIGDYANQALRKIKNKEQKTHLYSFSGRSHKIKFTTLFIRTFRSLQYKSFKKKKIF